MKIIASFLTLVVAVTAQNVIQVPPPGAILPQVEQPEFAPVQSLAPFNVGLDGLNGQYNAYPNAIGAAYAINGLPYNNFAPNPYQYPISAYPHPVYPNPAYPQFPGFSQFPQLFPQFPSPFQPSVHPVLQPQTIPYGAPPANPAAVSYANYQTHQPSQPQQLMRPASPSTQGVNGAPKPVTTPYTNSPSNNQAYGSAYGRYVPTPSAAAPSPSPAARYEAVSGDTVHTASLPGHDKDYKVVSGQATPAVVTDSGKQ